MEVVKGLNRNGVEVIEKFERVNGKSGNEDTRNIGKIGETTQVLEWKDGIGTLIGTSLKVIFFNSRQGQIQQHVIINFFLFYSFV